VSRDHETELADPAFDDPAGQQTGSKRLKSAWLNHAEAGGSKPGNQHE
jgi:hypothetical protein